MCAKRYLHARSATTLVSLKLSRDISETVSNNMFIFFKEKNDVLVVSRVFQTFQLFARYSWSSIYVIDDRKFKKYVVECEKVRKIRKNQRNDE